MIDDPLEPSTSTPAGAGGAGGLPSHLLRPRHELFEHGLLPIPKLIFSDGTLTLTLTPLKQRLLQLTSGRVDAVSLADALQISAEHASLALETLAAVLPGDPDPASADLYDLMLFLYVQSYKRLVPRAHKDSVAVADVWPSNSAFDGYLSALLPLQVLNVLLDCSLYAATLADLCLHKLMMKLINCLICRSI